MQIRSTGRCMNPQDALNGAHGRLESIEVCVGWKSYSLNLNAFIRASIKQTALHKSSLMSSWSLSISQGLVSIYIKVCSFYGGTKLWVFCNHWRFFEKENISNAHIAKTNQHCSSENEAHSIFAVGKWICAEAIPRVCFDRCQLMDICTKVSEMPYFTPSVSWHMAFLYLLRFH